LLWLAWPATASDLTALLTSLNLTGLVLRGQAEQPLIGRPLQPDFGRRVKQALDPDGRFPEV
jgi:hypothetical protein